MKIGQSIKKFFKWGTTTKGGVNGGRSNSGSEMRNESVNRIQKEDHDIPNVATASTMDTGSSFGRDPNNTTNVMPNKEGYEKYGIQSPPKNPDGRHHCEYSEVKERVMEDGFGKYIKKNGRNNNNKESNNEETKKCLVYLEGRGYYRDPKYILAMGGPDADLPERELQEKVKETRIRFIKHVLGSKQSVQLLSRLLDTAQGEEGDKDLTLTKELFFRNQSLSLKRYFEQPGSFGFLPNMNLAKFYFRIQQVSKMIKRCCFLHAPCVFLPYLCQKHEVEINCPGPVDISKFILRAFKDDELHKYLAGHGGNSAHVLGAILEPLQMANANDGKIQQRNEKIIYPASEVYERSFDLQEKMNKYGPALVREFSCHRNFDNPNYDETKVGYMQFTGRSKTTCGKFVALDESQNNKVAEAKSIEVDLKSSSKEVASTSETSGFCARRPSPCALSYSESMNKGTTAGMVNSTKTQEYAGKKQTRSSTTEEHSMLLIGGRRDEKGKLFLLFQNWWEQMPLVEVDQEYFDLCDASLVFVHPNALKESKERKNVNLEKCYEINTSLVAEAHNLDRPEKAREGCFDRRVLEGR